MNSYLTITCWKGKSTCPWELIRTGFCALGFVETCYYGQGTRDFPSLQYTAYYCAFQKHTTLTFAFFAAINHLRGPLRKQKFTSTGSKGHGLWLVIGEFWSLFCVPVFQGSLLVIVIMIDGGEKCNCEGGFWFLWFLCFWKAQ